MSDLTTLANVKQYLTVNVTTDDALLTRLISAASAFIQSWLNRNLASQTYTETRNGHGGYVLPLANYPVTAVSSVAVDNVAIPAASDPTQTGYVFSDKALYLNGYCFSRGFQNVAVTYTAGFATIPLDIEQACIDLVGLKYKERNHIGQTSKTLGQETINYSQMDISDAVKATLSQYRKVITV